MSVELEFIRNKWASREGYPVLTTNNSKGVPNSIYFYTGGFFDDKHFFIADNYFYKTRKNIETGTMATVLFLNEDKSSYQIKGKIELVESGPIFDAMKSMNAPDEPGRAAAALHIESVYSGAKRLL